MKFSNGATPIPVVDVMQTIGKIFLWRSADRKPFPRSFSSSVPASKNLFIKDSSVSAIFSISSSWSWSAFCFKSPGISFSVNLPMPSLSNFNSFILMRSITLSNSVPWLTGNWAATTSWPKRSFAVSTTRSKSAFSLSSLLITIIAGTFRFLAWFHTISDPTSTPSTALSRTTARSAT